MSEIDWEAIIVALVGSGGLITMLVAQRRHAKKPKADRRTEEAATAAESPHMVIPSAHDAKAITLAQSAIDQAAVVSDRLKATETRLNEVEKELGMFRRSYLALYSWSQRIIYDWDALRNKPEPPELPADIHHP